jgi:hypothetical protein
VGCSGYYTASRPLESLYGGELSQFPLSLVALAPVVDAHGLPALDARLLFVTRRAVFDAARRSCTLISPPGASRARLHDFATTPSAPASAALRSAEPAHDAYAENKRAARLAATWPEGDVVDSNLVAATKGVPSAQCIMLRLLTCAMCCAVDAAKVQQVVDRAFVESRSVCLPLPRVLHTTDRVVCGFCRTDGIEVRSRAVVVLYEGQIVAEGYDTNRGQQS